MIGQGQPGAESATVQIGLTGEFQLLIDGSAVSVPHGVQRVLAFLAVARCPVPRARIAGRLWRDASDRRALGNLRSALWRLGRIPQRIVQTVDERLALCSNARIDVAELTELSGCVLAGDCGENWSLASILELAVASDLLPGWEDEWLIVARERFRELRLHALERACEGLLSRGDYAGAIQAGLAAVECEPYRESSRRLLVRVHLSEGNRAAALTSYLSYRNLISTDLGIQPSEQMLSLVAELAPATPVPTMR